MASDLPFTTGWISAFQTARTLAHSLRHRRLTADHVFGGLASTAGSSAADTLASIGVSQDELFAQIAASDPSSVEALDRFARNAINFSYRLEHWFFGAEHLLLMLLSPHVSTSIPVLDELRRRVSAEPTQSPTLALLAGWLHGANMTFAPAEAAFNHFLGMVGASGQPRQIGSARLGIGMAQLQLDRTAEALENFATARDVLSSLDQDDGLDGLDFLLAHSKFRVGTLLADHDAAITELRDALATYVGLPGTSFSIMQCCVNLGYRYEVAGEFDRSAQFYQAASFVQAANPSKVPNETSALWTQRVSECQAKRRAALESGPTAASFFWGLSQFEFARVHIGNRDHDSAKVSAERALDAFTKAGAHGEVAQVRLLLAQVEATAGGDAATARSHYRAAVQTYERADLPLSAAITEGRLAEFLQSRGLNGEAAECFRSAHDASLLAGDVRTATNMIGRAAVALAQDGRNEAATEAFARSRMLAARYGGRAVAQLEIFLAGQLRLSGRGYDEVDAVLRRAYACALQERQFSIAVEAASARFHAAKDAGDFEAMRQICQRTLMDLAQMCADDEYSAPMRTLAANAVVFEASHQEHARNHLRAGELFLEAAQRQQDVGQFPAAAHCLHAAGKQFLCAHDYEAALRCMTETADRFHDNLPLTELAGVMLNRGTVLNLLGRKDEAREMLREAQRRFLDLGDVSSAKDAEANLEALEGRGESSLTADPDLANTAVGLRDEAFRLLKNKQPAQAIPRAHRSYEIFKELKQPTEALKALELVAAGYRDQGDPQKALEVVLGGYDEARAGHSLARLDSLRGTIHYELGQGNDAIECLTRAIAGFSSVGATALAANAHRELGQVHSATGRTADADAEFEAAARLYAGLPDERNWYASTLSALAQTKIGLGQFEKAREHITALERVSHEMADRSGPGRCALLRGTADLAQGNVPDALTSFEVAESSLRACGFRREAAVASANRALALKRTGDHVTAIRILQSAADAFTLPTMEDRLAAASVDFNLGTLYDSSGDAARSLAHLTAARDAYAALGNMASVVQCEHALAWRTTDDLDRRAAARRINELVPSVRARGNQALLAETLMGLGRAYRTIREFPEAESAFREARELYFTMNRIIDVAQADLMLGAIAGSSGRPHREALDLLLPAAIYIDAQRHRFAQPERRLQWKDQIEYAFAIGLEAAHREGDVELIADLVDYQLNAGVYTKDSTDAAEPSMAPGADGASTVNSEALLRRGAAAGRLLADGTLPMMPAPRLLRADGRVILGRYLQTVDERYAVIERPEPVTVP